MVPEDTAECVEYVGIVIGTVSDILEEAKKHCYNSNEKLNLNLLRKNAISQLNEELKKDIRGFLKRRPSSLREYAEMNERLIELLTTLKSMVETEINYIKEGEEEEMLGEESKNYSYL